jgi:plastocyanin
MKTFAAALVTVLSLGLAFGCGSSSSTNDTVGGTPTAPPPPPSSPTSGSVSIQDFTYAPETLNITVGGEVTWRNNGPSVHMTVSDAGLWNSGTLAAPEGGGGSYGDGGSGSGGTFSRVFSQAGTYAYHCEIHPYIRGSIIVSE